MAALSFVIVAGAALLIQLLVYHVNRLGTVLVAASVAALLMFHLTNGIRNRRMATERRLRAISELNHHVRNGLQQIAAVTTVHASGGYEEYGVPSTELSGYSGTARPRFAVTTEFMRSQNHETICALGKDWR
ncbi:MAG: hypothetical protein ACXVZR_13550 [Terriglobales bacterium]